MIHGHSKILLQETNAFFVLAYELYYIAKTELSWQFLLILQFLPR
ncbi:hypothetical protein HMPREF3230_01085 [Gardnerella vaginalis]|uniref:Uncharacterized protein n=1 Tax=Gardnerella vaginalis TaxID=2702 RepID=A0A135Z492_GARVA|nr:hypothetical protein HMPREF3230_01085 [Gardnerella vaginalis]